MAKNRNRSDIGQEIDRSTNPQTDTDPMAEQQDRNDHPEHWNSETLTAPRDTLVNPHLHAGLAWGQPTDVVHGGQPVPDSEARDRQHGGKGPQGENVGRPSGTRASSGANQADSAQPDDEMADTKPEFPGQRGYGSERPESWEQENKNAGKKSDKKKSDNKNSDKNKDAA